MTEQQNLNQQMADAIKEFLIANKVSNDTRVYFNDKCYHFDSAGQLEKTIEGIQPSDYFEYANNDTVAVAFEGPFYMVMNHAYENRHWRKVEESFQEMLEKKFGYYYELGHAWNLSLYKI